LSIPGTKDNTGGQNVKSCHDSFVRPFLRSNLNFSVRSLLPNLIPIPPTVQEGDYIIMLEVEDSQGAIGTDEVPITVTR
jgi:hypothetical protein